jgi:hypothetical protein
MATEMTTATAGDAQVHIAGLLEKFGTCLV